MLNISRPSFRKKIRFLVEICKGLRDGFIVGYIAGSGGNFYFEFLVTRTDVRNIFDESGRSGI